MEQFDDAGRRTHTRELTEDRTPTGLQQIFYGNGTIALEERFSAPDTRGRTRLEARKAWDENGRLTADDEILEDGSRQPRKAGGQRS